MNEKRTKSISEKLAEQGRGKRLSLKAIQEQVDKLKDGLAKVSEELARYVEVEEDSKH